jgi:PAS domain S-box-containing protein
MILLNRTRAAALLRSRRHRILTPNREGCTLTRNSMVTNQNRLHAALERVEQTLRNPEHAIDIDDRRQTEHQLRLLIDAIPIVVWSSDRKGIHHFANRRWWDYTGLAEGYTVGTAWESVAHPEDVSSHAAAWQACLASGEPFAHETRFRRANGEYRWFAIHGVPMRDEHGMVIRWLGTCTYIDDRKRAEEDLHQAQGELARVSRVTALGEVSASIAHEIRQPLGAIVATAEAGLNWLGTDPVNLEGVREALRDIVKDGNRAADILSRIRALLSRSVVLKESCDLTAIVEETLPLVRADFARGGINWRASCASNLPRVWADRIQLQQVLLNLLMNAAEACRELPQERRCLTVHTSVEYRGDLPWAVLEVEDSGIGFGEHDTARLFEAFYSTKTGGLGMGLSISRSIIESHGGRIWASANADHGVTMHFALPCIR